MGQKVTSLAAAYRKSLFLLWLATAGIAVMFANAIDPFLPPSVIDSNKCGIGAAIAYLFMVWWWGFKGRWGMLVLNAACVAALTFLIVYIV